MESLARNISNDATLPNTLSSNYKIIFYASITITTSCIGTIGNCLVIGALLVHKKLRVLSNVFVGNLAVADLCVSAVTNQFITLAIFHPRFFHIYPEVCEALAVLCTMTCLCSVWSMTMISLNRYFAICHNVHYRKIYNKKTIPIIIALMWTYCFMLDLSNFFGWGRHVFDAKAYFCTIDYTAAYSYNMYFILLGLFIPMIVTGFSYSRIYMFVRKSKQRLKSHLASPIKRTDLKLLKSVAAIFITFVVMWTPYGATWIFDFTGSWPQLYWVLAVALAHTNSSINCILYAATNQNFRDGYMILIKKVCCCSNISSDSSKISISSISDKENSNRT